MLELNKLLVMN